MDDNKDLNLIFETETTRIEPQTIDDKKIVHEIAFHEAGHLVFDILGLRLGLGFAEVFGYEMDAQNRHGQVIGFYHGAEKRATRDGRKAWIPTDIRHWYREDKRRVATKILTLMAGYATYRNYLASNEDEKEAFITVLTDDRSKLYYYTIDNRTIPQVGKGNMHDFERIQLLMGYLSIETWDYRLECERVVLEELDLLMQNPRITNAIKFAKNRLKNSRGSRISGKKFRAIVKFINHQVKRVDYWPHIMRITSQLIDCEKRTEEYKEKLRKAFQ